jgi:hypothetical protein
MYESNKNFESKDVAALKRLRTTALETNFLLDTVIGGDFIN